MIYYVEDDQSIRELVLYTLRQAGFQAKGFEDGKGFVRACEKDAPEMILLDVMLPGEDGYVLLRSLKENAATRGIPVIMITARGAEYDKVVGLDGGADDYIVKPFGMMEFISRVKAVLRRGAPEPARAVLAYGPLRMDEDMHAAYAFEKPVPLTFKEYELLKRLMENPGMAFTREKLLDEVWGYDYAGGTRTVDVHVQTLRQKLGAAGDQIETVRGVGYRLGGV
jgi:two-component system alkaline phosphatase synthesis response regulator PhoP